MIKQPSAPYGVLPPLKSISVENSRKPVRLNVFGRISHKSKMAVGLKGRAKTDMKSKSIGNKGTMDGASTCRSKRGGTLAARVGNGPLIHGASARSSDETLSKKGGWSEGA